MHPQEGEKDQPYIVTELMRGDAVEDVGVKAPDHKMPLERALKIAVETCPGLEFAHDWYVNHRSRMNSEGMLVGAEVDTPQLLLAKWRVDSPLRVRVSAAKPGKLLHLPLFTLIFT